MKKLLAILAILFSYGFAFNQTNVSIPQAGIYGGPTTGDDGIVGNLKGQYSVSPSGGMIYSLPIITPPGAGGMSPSLSINYNSQGGNGLLGLGWNLSGVSAIIRTGKDNYHDGEIQGMDFTLNDKFVLDGSRLEVVSGTYGASGSSYKTEVESYSSITAIGSSTNGPQSFIVKTKDGLTIEYGNTSDSRIEANISSPTGVVSKWLINKITNLEGYYIVFNYMENYTTGEVVLNNINYSNNDNLNFPTFQYSLVFSYSISRVDNIKHYKSGALFESKYLLTKIEIKHNDQTKYMYDFEYINSSFGPQFSYLKKIQLSASKFEKTVSGLSESWNVIKDPLNSNKIIFDHYNPLEINWTSEGTCTFGSAIDNTGDFCYADGYWGINSRKTGDFNGDGKADIIGQKINGQTYQVGNVIFHSYEYNIALSNGNGFSQSATWKNEIDIYNEIVGNMDNHPLPILEGEFKIGDIDGDGMDDIIIFGLNSTVYLKSKGNGFVLSDYFQYFSTNDNTSERYLGDVNGDGRLDIIGYKDDGVYVAISQGNTFNKPTKWTSFFSTIGGWNNPQLIRTVADINGDGMLDLIGFGNQVTSVYFSTGNSFVSGISLGEYSVSAGWPDPSKYPRMMADVNGDGMADIVGFNEDDVIVSLSKGNAFIGATTWSANMGYNDGYDEYDDNGNLTNDSQFPSITARMLADMNGDGMADLLAFDKNRVHVELSTGTSFSNSNNTWHTGYCYNSTFANIVKYPRMSGDYNGDGISDIIGFGETVYSVSFSNNSHSLVSSIKDSYDAEETFEYRNITTNDCYTKGTSTTYPLLTFQKPLNVLYKYGDLLNLKNTRYDYTNAIIHIAGKGFLGFEKTEISQNFSGIYKPRQVTEYLLNNTYYFLYPNKIYNYNDIGLISETTLSLTVLNSAPSGTNYKMYKAYNDKVFTLENHYEINQSNSFKRSILKTTTIDNYSNPITQNEYISANVRSVNDGPSSYEYSNLVTNTFYNNTTNHFFGFPLTSTSTTKSPNNSDDIHFVEYTYYSNPGEEHRVQTITSTPNNSSQFTKTTTIQYDAYGNISYKKISATGLPDVEENYTFLQTSPYYGRFQTQKIIDPNGLNFASNVSYNPVTGEVLKETDINGLETNYEYNNFSQLLKTTNPDGTEIHSALRWAFYDDPPTNDEPTGTLLYGWNASSGNAPEYKYYNKYSQLLRTVELNFNGQKLYYDNVYNNGKLTLEYSPYFKGSNPVNYSYKNYTDNLLVEVGSNINFATIEKNGFQSITKYYENNSALTPYKTKTESYNILDQLIEVNDDGGNIIYDYYSNGKSKSIRYDGNTTYFNYDEAGNKTSIIDPNAGTISYTYNAYNQLLSQTNARNLTTNFYYDNIGRISQKSCASVGDIIYYVYDNAPNSNSNITTFGLLQSVVLTNSNNSWSQLKTYEYDNYNRLATTVETVDNQSYSFGNIYNSDGKISLYSYPSGLQLYYRYNQHGYLEAIEDANDGTSYWSKTTENEYMQTTASEIGGIPIVHTYSNMGILESIQAGASGNLLQDLEYDFDIEKGNLNYRIDHIKNMGEQFSYDILNRLVSYQVTDANLNPLGIPNTISYSNNGNIDEKSDVGNYNYQLPQPNAVSQISNPIQLPAEEEQNIEYTYFNKVQRIQHINEEKELEYFYNSDNERAKTIYSRSNNIELTKYFIHGDYEIEQYNQGNRILHYINSPDGLVAIVQKSNNSPQESYFVLKDHLGSIYAIADIGGTIVNYNGSDQIFSFDPWGNRRDATDWTQPFTSSDILFDRGFTGHQMLDEFGIIDMNGRIYDPIIARFFSPDPLVQAPGFSQSYNRYSYVMNNPLVLTDPTGYWAGWDDLIVGGAGFAFGYASYGLSTGNWGWKAVGSGAISAGMFMVGYYTGGAGTASYGSIASGFSAGGFQAGANTVALAYSGGQVAAGTLNSFFNPVSIQFGNNINISVTPGFSFGPGGFTFGLNYNASYSNGNNNISVGFGATPNSYSWGVGATVNGVGGMYYQTHYGDAIGPDGVPNNQVVGGLNFNWRGGSFRIENDFFAFNHQDRWRSNAVELTIGNFVLGTNLYNNDPKGSGSGVDLQGTDGRGNLHPLRNLIKDPKGAWENGQTYYSPYYVGYKNGNNVYRLGYNHPSAQDITQNNIHRLFPPGYQNFYNKYNYFQCGTYGYFGYSNPYSLW